LPPGVAGIFLRKPVGAAGPNIYWLSNRGTLAEIARNLYRVLRQADLGRHREIWVEALPADAGGIAAALNDRLKRAAAKR
jgi:L-threonylcarbamoyladenylate synthase